MSYINLTARIRLQNVILATDFSEASKAAVGYAAAIARGHGEARRNLGCPGAGDQPT